MKKKKKVIITRPAREPEEGYKISIESLKKAYDMYPQERKVLGDLIKQAEKNGHIDLVILGDEM